MERDEIRLGPFFSCPDAQQECCEPGSTLLCMGLFSRFFVQALPCTAEGTLCRVRDTRSLVPRAYGTNRSNSNTSCSVAADGVIELPCALTSPACAQRGSRWSLLGVLAVVGTRLPLRLTKKPGERTKPVPLSLNSQLAISLMLRP